MSFSYRRRLCWEQVSDDAGNGSSLTAGADAVDCDAEVVVVSGTTKWGREIGKAVSGGAATEERDGDIMKALRDERMGNDDRGDYRGGGKAAASLLRRKLRGRGRRQWGEKRRLRVGEEVMEYNRRKLRGRGRRQ
ncbi:hypothetical protein B296_00046469 [Ensete ventricosum]|uniref:Uncharacterized protein n=1 Tax=Ensete ventricosum TaxID=4639 RepID=A0A426X736_ENSVE|nr:hypothetical protein B296_00046469 [Ensete ventricosum]